MKRELYRTIALVSMVALACGTISAQEPDTVNNAEAVKTEENIVSDVKTPEGENCDDEDDMDMREFLLGRFAVHFEKENLAKTAMVGIPVLLVATAAAYKFWPRANAAGAQPSSSTGSSDVAASTRQGSASMPTTPVRGSSQSVESSSYTTPGGRVTYTRGSKSVSPNNKRHH